MYKLYGCTGTGSAAVEAVLAEIGADYETVMLDVSNDEHRAPEYLAMNPRGQVPWLVTPDGHVLSESSAIALHIADSHPQAGLIGPLGSAERAHTYRWMAFLATNIYEGVLRSGYSDRYTTGTDTVGVKAAADSDIDRAWNLIEEALEPGPSLLGSDLCVADIYMAMMTAWHPDPGQLLAEHPRLKRAVETVLARPAIRNVFERNKLI